MTTDQQIKNLYDDIITLTLQRMHTKPQLEWESLHNQILEKEKQIKILKQGGVISEPKVETPIQKPKAKLTTEFTL